RSLTPSLGHSLTHSLIHSLTPSFSRSVTHSLIRSLTHSLGHSLPHSLPRAHSKFIPEGSQRVGLDVSEETELETVAFIRPEGTAVIIVLNRTSRDLEFVIWDQDLGYINAVAPGNSIQTYLWARA
uniref:galactosylceramidase n=1 Tax=Callorhinchus milii TaxID=7868 RepID=A0A4W3GGE9_CALMI